MSPSPLARRATRPLLALAMPTLLALTACGDGSDSGGSSDSGSSASAYASASTSASASPSVDDAFAACLAEQGLELPAEGETPDPGSFDPEQMQAAMEACGDLAPDDLPSAEPDQSALDAFADCMKERKIDVEPTLEAIQQLDREDAQVDRALERCSALLGQPGTS